MMSAQFCWLMRLTADNIRGNFVRLLRVYYLMLCGSLAMIHAGLLVSLLGGCAERWLTGQANVLHRLG